MTRKDGGPAFPVYPRVEGAQSVSIADAVGLSLRDWFATFAPTPSEEAIAFQFKMDHQRNPYNTQNKPKLRSRGEIVASLNWQYADDMLSERGEEG